MRIRGHERGYSLINGECVSAVDFDMSCESLKCYATDDEGPCCLEFYYCAWHCAEYEGEPDRFVSVVFDRSAPAANGCYRIVRVNNNTGICDREPDE